MLGVILVLLLLPYVFTLLYLFVRPVSTPMVYRWMTGRARGADLRAARRHRPGPAADGHCVEDARFCRHRRIDWKEVAGAIETADEFGDIRGASTITQQTAKNLFLWHGRSYLRKALDIPLALWIDLVLPKRRIMEIYLNIAEWGPNGEFGAEAGARRAFGISARELNATEAAMLAAVLPNPIRRSARQPGPGVRRLTGIYQARAAAAPALDACLRRPGDEAGDV